MRGQPQRRDAHANLLMSLCLALFVPLTKGDHRGSQAFSAPPAAKNAGKLSQSFHSLAKGDKASILAREMHKLKAADMSRRKPIP